MDQVHQSFGQPQPIVAAQSDGTAPTEATGGLPARVWASPGVSPKKRVMTAFGVALASVIFFAIAYLQGGQMLVSTIIGLVFIGGFVWYLRTVAPTPFTITLDGNGITRAEIGGEPVAIPWTGVAKIKEEVFPSGKPVSIAVFKRVGERGLHRAWVVYGDDLEDFAGFIAALRRAVPEDRPWLRETVHE